MTKRNLVRKTQDCQMVGHALAAAYIFGFRYLYRAGTSYIIVIQPSWKEHKTIANQEAP